MPKGDLEDEAYVSKLMKRLNEYEQAELYPPRFHVIFRKQDETAPGLNFQIIVANTKPEVTFHVVTFNGNAAS